MISCKKRLKEKFASFEQANEPIANCEAKLTADVYRQIVETRKLNDFLTSTKTSADEPKEQKYSAADRKADKKRSSVNGSGEEVTFYEMVNFMNKLEREAQCFTISNPQPFKQIIRAHKWLVLEENYMNNFSLKNYEVATNMKIDQAEYIAEGLMFVQVKADADASRCRMTYVLGEVREEVPIVMLQPDTAPGVQNGQPQMTVPGKENQGGSGAQPQPKADQKPKGSVYPSPLPAPSDPVINTSVKVTDMKEEDRKKVHIGEVRSSGSDFQSAHQTDHRTAGRHA